MPASNLAVCFAPSLFQIAMNNPKFKLRRWVLGTLTCILPDKARQTLFCSALTRRHSIDIKAGHRGEKDIVESVAAHQCLTFMIKGEFKSFYCFLYFLECKKLFKVPFELMNGLSQHEDYLMNDFGLNPRAHPIELRYFTALFLDLPNHLLIVKIIIMNFRHYIDHRLSMTRSWVKLRVFTVSFSSSSDNNFVRNNFVRKTGVLHNNNKDFQWTP